MSIGVYSASVVEVIDGDGDDDNDDDYNDDDNHEVDGIGDNVEAG